MKDYIVNILDDECRVTVFQINKNTNTENNLIIELSNINNSNIKKLSMVFVCKTILSKNVILKMFELNKNNALLEIYCVSQSLYFYFNSIGLNSNLIDRLDPKIGFFGKTSNLKNNKVFTSESKNINLDYNNMVMILVMTARGLWLIQ